jgi:hypothetical protein
LKGKPLCSTRASLTTGNGNFSVRFWTFDETTVWKGIKLDSMPDAELRRLEEIERVAHDRFARLSEPSGISDPATIKAAKEIWAEAASAVRLYKVR